MTHEFSLFNAPGAKHIKQFRKGDIIYSLRLDAHEKHHACPVLWLYAEAAADPSSDNVRKIEFMNEFEKQFNSECSKHFGIWINNISYFIAEFWNYSEFGFDILQFVMDFCERHGYEFELV